MYISRVKSKGNYYFYAYSYVYQDKKKIVASLGKKEEALENLREWKEKIPDYLVDEGIKNRDIDNWIKKISDVI